MIPNIRKATEHDIEGLCQLIAEVDELHRDHLPHKFRTSDGPARERQFMLDLIEREDVGLFVAEHEEQQVGFVHVVVHDAPDFPIVQPRRTAWVDSIAVGRAARRGGIGRALMERAQQWALAMGAREIVLKVYQFNQSAIEFYRRLGYDTLAREMAKTVGDKGAR